MRRLLMTVGLMLAMVGWVGAGPAAAASTYIKTSSATNAAVRTCASTTCSIKARVPDGRSAQMKCWWDGQWTTGNYRTNRWFKVTAPLSLPPHGTSVTGMVHASYVYNQTRVPKCKSSKG